jgi:hypothetical protein
MELPGPFGITAWLLIVVIVSLIAMTVAGFSTGTAGIEELVGWMSEWLRRRRKPPP